MPVDEGRILVGRCSNSANISIAYPPNCHHRTLIEGQPYHVVELPRETVQQLIDMLQAQLAGAPPTLEGGPLRTDEILLRPSLPPASDLIEGGSQQN